MNMLNTTDHQNNNPTAIIPFHRMLRLQQVLDCTGLSRSTIYDLMDVKSKRHDPTFPKQVKLSANSVGWVESEIQGWITSKIKCR